MSASCECSSVTAGDSFGKTWLFADASNTPIDLTGCTAFFGITAFNGMSIFQTNTGDGLGYLRLAALNNDQIANPGNVLDGVVLAIPGEAAGGPTGVWPPGSQICAIKILFPDQTEFTYLPATVAISPAVTLG